MTMCWVVLTPCFQFCIIMLQHYLVTTLLDEFLKVSINQEVNVLTVVVYLSVELINWPSWVFHFDHIFNYISCNHKSCCICSISFRTWCDHQIYTIWDYFYMYSYSSVCVFYNIMLLHADKVKSKIVDVYCLYLYNRHYIHSYMSLTMQSYRFGVTVGARPGEQAKPTRTLATPTTKTRMAATAHMEDQDETQSPVGKKKLGRAPRLVPAMPIKRKLVKNKLAKNKLGRTPLPECTFSSQAW